MRKPGPGGIEKPRGNPDRLHATYALFAVLLAILASFLPARPAHAFLEALQCGMDPLYDMCIGIEIERVADPLKPGAVRDTAF